MRMENLRYDAERQTIDPALADLENGRAAGGLGDEVQQRRPRVVAVLQARCGSSRFPRKVLASLGSEPVIERCVERALGLRTIDALVLATTDDRRDDELAERFANRCVPIGGPDFMVMRGSEHDVLERTWRAASRAVADVVVRLTGDTPLMCPRLADELIGEFLERRRRGLGLDFLSNSLEGGFALGFAVEISDFGALTVAHREATLREEREHVMPFLWRRPCRFRLGRVVNSADHSHLRLTVDTREDLEVVRRVYQAVSSDGVEGHYREFVACLEARPAWQSLNRHVVQRSVSATVPATVCAPAPLGPQSSARSRLI